MADICTEKILSEDYADFMIGSESALKGLIEIPDSCYIELLEKSYSVYIPVKSVPNNMLSTYGYGVYPNCYGIMDSESLNQSQITKIQEIPGLNLKGEGVLIGLVDTGIDYQHEAFIKEDGTSKIVAIWDQTINNDLIHPSSFPYGSEYLQEQINLALKNENPLSIVPSTDEVGHGTFLAGIAIGNRNENEAFSGVVPDAEIVVVKLKQAKKNLLDFWRIPDDVLAFQKNDLIMGIRYLEEVANQLKRPISIMIGIGTSQGAHDERGELSTYLSRLATRGGICLTICAGNEGNSGHHYLGEVSDSSDKMELIVESNITGFSMEIWGSMPINFSIDIKTPTGEYIPRIAPRSRLSRKLQLIFSNTVIYVDYQLVEAQSGEQLILLRFVNPIEGVWTFNVYSEDNISFRYHCWLPIVNFLSERTHFISPSPEYTLTSPGNTFIPIVTTAYDIGNGGRYVSASKGFMRNNNISPTIAAPGVNLIGPNIQGGYKKLSGTSLAAAHTAGVGAMLLEWGIVRKNYSQISTVEIRNLMIRGAKKSNDLTYPNKEWGFGILNAYSAFETFRNTRI